MRRHHRGRREKVDTARFDGKPVLFTRVDDGIHKPEELIKKIAHGEVPVYHAEGGAEATESADTKDSFGRSLYKNLMNGVSHMLPFVVGGGIMIALAFLLDDYTIDPSNFGMNTPSPPSSRRWAAPPLATCSPFWQASSPCPSPTVPAWLWALRAACWP